MSSINPIGGSGVEQARLLRDNNETRELQEKRETRRSEQSEKRSEEIEVRRENLDVKKQEREELRADIERELSGDTRGQRLDITA